MSDRIRFANGINDLANRAYDLLEVAQETPFGDRFEDVLAILTALSGDVQAALHAHFEER